MPECGFGRAIFLKLTIKKYAPDSIGMKFGYGLEGSADGSVFNSV